jgi:type II secretory pathway pseudopilin PulG
MNCEIWRGRIKMMSGRRWGFSGDRGTTLVELVLVVFIVAIVAVGLMPGFASFQRAVASRETSDGTLSEARAAAMRLGNELRSGVVLSDPGVADPTCPYGSCLRTYVVSGAGTGRCVEWRLNGATLQRRSWSPLGEQAPPSWEDVAHHIANLAAVPPVPFFALDPLTSGRTLHLTLLVAADPAGRSQPVSVRTVMTARNAPSNAPAGACAS